MVMPYVPDTPGRGVGLMALKKVFPNTGMPNPVCACVQSTWPHPLKKTLTSRRVKDAFIGEEVEAPPKLWIATAPQNSKAGGVPVNMAPGYSLFTPSRVRKFYRAGSTHNSSALHTFC